ncbi:MAG: FAD-dependent oxidoreductase [Bacillota bacterium]|nr:FAD-dependent oxidoreductase [Bacillota bacterium]
MKKVDLLVIGGSAGGILSATTARKVYGDISIAVIRDTNSVMIPCGIPYIFGTLKDTKKNLIPDGAVTNSDIELIIDRVTKINREEKNVVTRDGETIEYKKLIIATGSLPFIPSFIPGHDLENVYPVLKEEEYLNEVLKKSAAAKNIVVIGGGFIGVEFAEQFATNGKNVTLVELADACVGAAFDKEYTDELEAKLIEGGIDVRTGSKVVKINGEKAVESIELESGEKIDADLVILGLGARPNGELAKEAGIEVTNRGAIIVDQYTRTSDPDVFAVGDCAIKKCFFTGKDVPILLASTATAEAKIAGSNAFELRLVRENKGTISAFATKVFGRTFAAAGLTEAMAKSEGFTLVTGETKTFDKHPGNLPGAQMLNVKFIFSKCSGVILGAQISGGDSAAEMINVLSLSIQNGITASQLNTFQAATHPLVTASPVAYPINAAAMDAVRKNCAILNAAENQ